MGVSGPSKQNSMITHIDEETSLEESVLQELKIVMNQVHRRTRLIFLSRYQKFHMEQLFDN